MSRSARLLWMLLPLLAGCGSIPTRFESRLPPDVARGVVFVAGGAGGRQDPAAAVADGADDERLGLHVRSFDWSHGLGRGLADVSDVAHVRCQGQLLAAEARRCLAEHPGVSVSLVGYSAGS